MASAPSLEALFDAGLAAHKAGNAAEALRVYAEVLAREPRHFNALHLSGLLETEAKNYARAVALISAALAEKPESAAAWYNLGIGREALGDESGALAAYEQALQRKPDFSQARVNRGNLLHRQRRTGDALAEYEAALAVDPGFVPALVNRGIALRALKQTEAALDSFAAALAHAPRSREALFGRALTLLELRAYPAALETLGELKAADPDAPELAALTLFTQLRVCDWNDYERGRAEIMRAIEGSVPAAAPFQLSIFTDDPEVLRRAAVAWIATKHPAQPVLGAVPVPPPRDKIRLGYFSRDYREHAVAQLIADLIETHDRRHFEVIGFSFGPDTGDAMQARIAAAFDRFIDVADLSDVETASQARALGIDVAIDLAGHTELARTGLFAAGAAPIQVGFLGYPGTMGAAYYDYVIADATLIPPGHEAFYTEKVARLPHSYQCNDRRRVIGARVFTRAELGLPASGFVFCCFNTNFKITPDVFDIWMRILRQVDGSVLWLLEDNPWASANLRTQAALRGIDSERLIFAPRAAHADHLSRHRAADLFLDTLPYNAHTTASDALWCGLPVLTRAGKSFAGRVAASLLHAVGLPELVVATEADYIALAVKLARDPLALAALRGRLQAVRTTAPLFDTPRFARDIERAFTHMVERRRAGLPAETFDV